MHALISSKLDSCNSLLYGLPQHLLNRFRAIQNTAARIVTLSKRFDHITLIIMFKLHWLPLNDRIHFKILLLVYKCLNGLASIYLSELLRYRNSPRLLRSSFFLFFFLVHFTGQDLLPRGKGHNRTSRSLTRCPTSPTPLLHTKDNHSTGITLLLYE